MQRERLEGWMVRQIENADLAKETVLQLPARTSAVTYTQHGTTSKAPPTSARRSLASPRRRPFTSLAASAEAAAAVVVVERKPLQRHSGAFALPMSNHKTHLLTSNTTAGLDEQRCAYFDHRGSTQSGVESGRVDRTKVLRTTPQHPRLLDDDDHGGNADARHEPLILWGLPREHIVAYIRQSVLPSSWAMSTKLTGEWEAVAADDDLEDDAANASPRDALAKALALLPPLASPSGHTFSSRSHGASSPPRRPHTSSFPGATSSSAPTSPRAPSTPRPDDRIHRVLNELRADPSLWAAFEHNVKQYQYEQRSKHKAFDKIRENKQRVQSPRLATALEEKKKQAEDRMARNKRQREQLVRTTEARLEARRLTYQLRVAACAKHHSSSISAASSAAVANPPHSIEERAWALGVRRRKVWLVTVAFTVVTTTWATKFADNKQLVRIAAQHARAAQTIQRLWRAWKWRCHASTPSVLLCARLRRCLWKLLFNVRCRRKARLATLLQRFMVDQCSGSRETRNFNRMMVKWRSNVIRSQRSSRDFVMCTRARLHTLAMWWDRIDHERQRQERHTHERRLVEQPPAQRVSLLPGATIATTSVARPSTRNSNSGTLLRLESMNEKLTSLQQVLTPIEMQRLQQHAFHVVRIAKRWKCVHGYMRIFGCVFTLVAFIFISVKMQLLHEYLALARKEFTHRLTQYTEQRLCASYTRKVRLDDARAIVQNSLSWGSLMLDRCVGPAISSSNDTSSSAVCVRRPVLALFAGAAARQRMEELVRRGVQLTLERDAEQRAVVERQRQVLDVSAALGSLPKKRESNGGGKDAASSALLLKKRESNGGRKDAASGALLLKKRQSTRRLGFLLPFFRDTGTPSNSVAAPDSSIAASASAAMASESVHKATDEADE